MAITSKTPVKFSLMAMLTGEKELVYGVVDVLATSTVQTGLQTIDILLVTLAEDPVIAEGLWATGEVTSDSTDCGEIVLKVWEATANNNLTPTAGTEAKLVAFLAIGKGPNG